MNPVRDLIQVCMNNESINAYMHQSMTKIINITSLTG